MLTRGGPVGSATRRAGGAGTHEQIPRTTMQRRNLLIGMGSLTVGGAATIGTGAFTSVEASRSVSVSVADDSEAFLRLAKVGSGDDQNANREYAETSDGVISIDVSDSNNSGFGGTNPNGLNPDSTTRIFDIFTVQNQGTQNVAVYVDADEGVRLSSSSSDNDVSSGAVSDGVVYENSDGDTVYVDPQATDRPNGDYDSPIRGVGGEISLTHIYDSGFPGSTDMYGLDEYTLASGESFDFGLWFEVDGDPTGFSNDISITLSASAEHAADLEE